MPGLLIDTMPERDPLCSTWQTYVQGIDTKIGYLKEEVKNGNCII